jgi:peptide deformylase
MISIITVPHSQLRTTSQAINLKRIDAKLMRFIQELASTLVNKTNPTGVGLSAIQVNQPFRMFFTYLPSDPSLPSQKWTSENLRLTLFINPSYTYLSPDMTFGDDPKRPLLEGCLSIPHLYGPVERHRVIKAKYYTFNIQTDVDYLKFNSLNHIPPLIESEIELSDFPARVFQHEYDHLEGVLFTDYTLKHQLPLYFDHGEEMTEIANPKEIIKW